jgi:ubiquinone/menaquinone biosynthesis C-methylase UbiE
MLAVNMDIEIESSSAEDCWFRWLNHGRDGGDAVVRGRVAAETAAFAEKILDLADRQPGDMLDIGSGTGLMAWAALSRWPDTHVTMTDISLPLLAQAATEANRRGLARQCRFLTATAESLEGAADASQDLVTSRSVLAYVVDKLAAFRSAFRTLRPGGTLCIAEPMMRDEALAACALRTAREDTVNPMAGLLHKWKAAQFPDTDDAVAANPMTNYTERELFSIARQAGFEHVHLELHIDERRIPPREWTSFCAMAPHPLAPSLNQILSSEFTPAERDLFETAMRPVVEKGEFGTASRMIYLRADKPR